MIGYHEGARKGDEVPVSERVVIDFSSSLGSESDEAVREERWRKKPCGGGVVYTHTFLRGEAG